MDIKISKAIAHHMGEVKMRSLGKELKDTYRDDYRVDLATLTAGQLTLLREWLDDMSKLDVRGPKTLIRDIDTWTAALKDAGNVRARTVAHFADILTEYLRKVPGHRVYKRLDLEGLAHVGFYVNKVVYHPPERSRDYTSPAYTEVELIHIELGGCEQTHLSFKSEKIQGRTASEVMVNAGYFPERPELREGYLAETDRFAAISGDVGRQFTAVGTGTDPLHVRHLTNQYINSLRPRLE